MGYLMGPGYLMGEDCCQPADNRYLGFAIAAAAPIAAATGPLAPFVLAFAALSTALPFIHIGAGRKEADQIVPEQNKLGEALGQLDQIIANTALSADDVRQLQAQLQQIWQNFKTFIYQDAFTADGDTRASDGARATMEPQVNGRLDTLNAMLSRLLGRPTPPALITGGSGTPSLEYRNTSDLNFAGFGTFQPGAVAPTGQQVLMPTAGGISNDMLLKLAVAGGLVLWLSRR